MTHILLVDDEPAILDIVTRYLSKEGYQVTTATNGQEALDHYRAQAVDLIITDIMMPQMDGYDFIDAVLQLREDQPFIFITAKDQAVDRIYSLTLGADDYLTKPFSPRELTLRVKKLLRRIQPKQAGQSVLSYAPFAIDEGQHRVTLYDQPLQLSLKEFQLLALFLKNPGRVFAKSELFLKIWETDYMEDANTLNVHIHSLRDKLAKVAGQRPYPKIETVWGLGYRLGGDPS